MERFELPEGWVWEKLSDLDVCQLNPRKNEVNGYPDTLEVTFVPMSAVDEVSGMIVFPQIRKLADVRKGYTYFAEGDVVFAKITPCMENGKSAIARGLRNGIGFGTTEFHVLRAGSLVTAEWLHLLVRSKDFRDGAQANMCGAAGQQRVPIRFLENVEIPIPPLAEQRRIVAWIEELTRRVEEARRLRREAVTKTLAFIPSFWGRLFDLAERKGWKKATLGNKNISAIIMGQSPEGSSYNRDGKGVPLLNGPTEFGAEHPTPMQWTTQPTRLCKEGDILFCVRGSTTGRMNWADRQYCIGRGIAAIRPNENNCLPKFLYAFIQTQSNAVLHYGEGGVFPNFNKDQLAAMEIPLLPIDEQRRIVQYLDNLQSKTEELKRLQTETESELASFTPALLAKAFRGEL